MEGELDSIVFPEILRDLYLAHATGLLQVQGHGIHARVYFSNGSVVFASSQSKQMRLGEMLVRRGTLSKQELESVLSELPKDTRLGRYLHEKFPVKSEQVAGAIEEQIRSLLLPIFNWSTGFYRFEEMADVETDEMISSISMADLILEGVRQMEDFQGIRKRMFESNLRFRLAQDPYSRFQKLTLTTEEGFIFSRIHESLTVKDLCDLAPSSEELTCRILYGLLAAGIFEPVIDEKTGRSFAKKTAAAPAFSPPAPRELRPETRQKVRSLYKRLSDYTHYQLLGVGPDASTAKINEAYRQRAAMYHPDHFPQPDVKRELEAIFARVVEAWKVLTDPEAREEYDLIRSSPVMLEDEEEWMDGPDAGPLSSDPPGARPEPSAPVPDPSLQKAAKPQCTRTGHEWFDFGRQFLNDKQHWRAIQCFRKAVQAIPDNATYRCILADTLALNPMWRKQAETEYKKALELNPFNTRFMLGLANLYMRGGRFTDAKKLYGAVLGIDPDCEEALEALPKPASASRNGVAGSLFRAFRRNRK